MNLVIGLGLGLLMFYKIKFGTAFRFIYLLPWVCSPVIIALVFRYIFNPEWGVANWFLVNIGLPKVMWTEQALYAIPVVACIQVWQSMGFGIGAGVGWAMAIVLMAGLRKKMGYSNVPRPFKGIAIAMIITGVMAMAFMGFAGMVSIQ